MAHYQVFVPQATFAESTQHPLVCAGLSDHVANADGIPLAEGPDGGPGRLYAWRNHTTNRRLHYNAAEQEWVPAVPVGDSPAKRYWVGFWNDSPPTESDLRRPGITFGMDIRLDNGEEWHIVIPAELPCTVMRGDGGTVQVRPKAKYRDLYLETARIRRRLSDPDANLPWEIPYDFICKCLRINYRIPDEVIGYLGLLDENNIKAVLLTVIGKGRFSGEQ